MKNIAEGFREFMYSYAFFEFFINILIDLSNIKKIIKRGNWLTWLLIIFEGMIILTEIIRFIKKITELDAEKEEKQKRKKMNHSLKIASVLRAQRANPFKILKGIRLLIKHRKHLEDKFKKD